MRFRRKGPTALADATVAAAFAGGTAIAAADPGGGDLYVSHAAIAGAADASCTTAAYSSVQAAVDAAHPGQTVCVCGTLPYEESILIPKDLKLTPATKSRSATARRDRSARTRLTATNNPGSRQLDQQERRRVQPQPVHR